MRRISENLIYLQRSHNLRFVFFDSTQKSETVGRLKRINNSRSKMKSNQLAILISHAVVEVNLDQTRGSENDGFQLRTEHQTQRSSWQLSE